MKTEVLSFRSKIFTNSNKELRERVKANGTVSEIRIRFYPGQEKALQVQPYVVHKNSRREDLFTYVANTDTFISGDDDYLVFPCSVDVEYDDEIAVFAFNSDFSFDYSLAVDIIINYFESGSEVLNNGE